jgi:predicted nucleotidyltransferase
MTREEAIARIKSHEAELRAGGINSLALFGSIARGDQRPDSDLDLMCDIDEGQNLSLFDFIGLRLRLEDIVGTHVDLVERAYMRPRIARRAMNDEVPIF